MAKIPLFQSTQPLTTKPPSVRRDPAVASQFGRDIAGAGSAILQANQTIRRAYDFQQSETAKVKTIEGTDALVQKALEDGENTGDLTAYESGFQELRNSASEGITNRSVKEQFLINFDLQAAQARTKIKSIFWARMKSKGIANMDRVNAELTDEYAETADPKILEAMELNIDAYVNQGFIRADTAETLKTNATLKAKKSNFVWDLNNNFKNVESKLASNAYNLTLDQLKNANSVYLSEKNRIQNEKEEDLDSLYFTEDLTDAVVDRYVSEKWVSPAIGNKWKKALKALEASKPDDFTYDSLVERAAEVRAIFGWPWRRSTEARQEEFKQATLLRIDVLNQIGLGIDKEDANTILGKMGNSMDDFEPYKKGILELRDFANRNYTAQERDRAKREIFREFMHLVENGTDPIKAINLAKATLYPAYKIEDLQLTSEKTGLTVKQVVDILNKERAPK